MNTRPPNPSDSTIPPAVAVPAPAHSPTTHPRIRPPWCFWLPLALQTALILVIPVQALHTQVTGKSVVLQTAPVDPYNFFRGYYVTLSYDISQVSTLEKLPGWRDVSASKPETGSASSASIFRQGHSFYVILQAPEATTEQPPAPWKPISVQPDRPIHLPANQVALRGTAHGGWVSYGLERYYIPEEQRDEINTQITQLQNQNIVAPFVVEAKVSAGGQALPMGFWLQGQEYRF